MSAPRGPQRGPVNPRVITDRSRRREVTPPGHGLVVTYVSESHDGCRLPGVPGELLRQNAGTLTRAEYDAWDAHR